MLPKMTQVTTLKRKATEVLAELKKDKQPILITEHGKPAAYLVDVPTYQANMKKLDEMEVLFAIAEGEADIEAGRVLPNAEVMKQLKKLLAKS